MSADASTPSPRICSGQIVRGRHASHSGDHNAAGQLELTAANRTALTGMPAPGGWFTRCLPLLTGCSAVWLRVRGDSESTVGLGKTKEVSMSGRYVKTVFALTLAAGAVAVGTQVGSQPVAAR